MKKAIVAAGMFLLVFGLPGCSSTAGVEADIEKQIQLMNETTEILNTIKDSQSLEEAKPKLKSINTQLAEVSRRMTAVKENISAEEDQRLKAKFADQWKAAVPKNVEAWNAAESRVPGARKALQELKSGR